MFHIFTCKAVFKDVLSSQYAMVLNVTRLWVCKVFAEFGIFLNMAFCLINAWIYLNIFYIRQYVWKWLNIAESLEIFMKMSK